MKTITLGDVSISQVEEWNGLALPVADMFPGIDRAEWDEDAHWLAPEHWSPEEDLLHISSESWLLESAGKIILIDTAFGNFKSRPNFPLFDQFDGPYLASLAQYGVKPDDVNLVISTHLHVDHVGWNTRLVNDEWVPTFGNARYLMAEPDVKFWSPDHVGPRVSDHVNEGMFADSVQPIIDAGLADIWNGKHVIDENLSIELAPGHTPGTAVVSLQSGTDRALFVGDMIHSPWQVGHGAMNSCFCEDPVRAVASRRKFLGYAADNSALVFPAHFAGDHAIEIERNTDRFAIKSWVDWK
ncbi:MBL fold metallo-hydrolase [Rhodococcus sp. 15-725-2-2b]|uniref:MBL fold metallo-hydrolase n=1 Tax=unclassified Rhodococcus (in: high G+C Gram-positive bacteria) TaxID=192944 RepID=UPI000B9B095D|nr:MULTISPECIES: MBL fold metallo-hydrolase [unclassified Rhodococcus (in: high G+C Gram-positive bacteria)]OZC63607.1 MBL fold metallo-hydrolase [Rhodococcus sp. 06-469-3-2]OZD40772.1 MBL fold metallo-hydrolase [Rhodococcus sp. 06-1477-1A]OZE67120.1 MBL fold metallo-hydrolase [Rhodococcus sp. 15-725-2-2b]